MQFWSSFRHYVAFTRQETIAIAFLTAGLVVGESVRWYRASGTPGGPATDYAAVDSEFVARSRAGSGIATEGARPPRKGAPLTRLAPESVDINTATLEQLIALPGIGPVTAGKIIAFRNENGPLESAEDLLEVKGIGPGKLERIRPYLRVQ